MARYIPKEFKDNPNVSQESLLKELFTLLAGLFGIILGVYIILGLMVDAAVSRMPEKVERDLNKLFTNRYKKEQTKDEEKVQKLLDTLVKELPASDRNYSVYIIDNPDFNAFAVPGGNIIILSGLFKQLDSEDELSFVFAHELGHFAHQDHLKALGRGLVLLVISSTLLGDNSSTSNFLKNSLTNTEMKFSQKQETNADLFAIDLLNKKYGHVGGAVKFMDKLEQKEKIPPFFYFFTTHPHPKKRIKVINEKIKKEKYLIKDTRPLEGFFKGFHS